MPSPLADTLQTVVQSGMPLLLSCLDDALLLTLTKLGVNLPWLQWLGTLLLTATVIYWTVRIIRFIHRRYAPRPLKNQS